MDVDLLRPGSVPIAADTVLWFEFLLHKDLLLSHLQKPNADPTPTELIAKFSDAVADKSRLECETRENPEIVALESLHLPTSTTIEPTKNIALKILSLKVAAFIAWDLTQIRSLSFKTQVHLLQDLLYFTSDKTPAEIPNIDHLDKDGNEKLSPPHLFALIIYHRWLLNVTMYRITSNWQVRMGNTEISLADESVFCSHDNVQKTVDFLIKSLSWTNIPDMLTFDCFQLPTETNDLQFEWTLSRPISPEEFSAQINFDLGTFFFYKEDYVSAKEHFTKSIKSYKAIKTSSGFVKLNPHVLDVYVQACSGPSEGTKDNLLEQLNFAVVNHYKGITTILQQDNVYRQIPLAQRLSLELDIQGALSSGTFTVARDLLYKIRALNLVRCILDGKPTLQYSTNLLKNAETLVWAVEASWNLFNENDKTVIKNHLLNVILKHQFPDLLSSLQSNNTLSNIFDTKEVQYILKSESDVNLPESLQKSSWSVYDFSHKNKPKLEIKQLEQDLIATYDYKRITELILKIRMNPFPVEISRINPEWDLPAPLESVIKGVPKGSLQDFSFVILAKAREQMLNKDWNSTQELLLILRKELEASNANMFKLIRLISWEILLVQISQLIEEWPKTSIDKNALANACEACLKTTDSMVPRTEITEQCTICLLNLGRWDFLTNFEKSWPYFEICAALALGCQEVVKHKGNKKFSKTLWDLVLPIFTSVPQSKRGGSSGNSSFHDSHHIVNLRNLVNSVFQKLRDKTVFAFLISMLGRLHNILRDEPSVELQAEYALLWPAVISNAGSYNTKMTCEVLSQIVAQALHYYPAEVSWLRLMADIYFSNSHYNSALKYYLQSLLIYHDYFDIPVRHDDHVFKRMIKCCISLGCNTQAAVLCQFLEEPDYVLAFRILADQKYPNDAVDAYYHCIWDTNILEFLIHSHHKRGEYQRRKCAQQVIGLLELNSNNNIEIQREASNLRKSTFLRALCKQYVLC